MHFTLCQAVKSELSENTLPSDLSRRAATKLEELREEYAWVSDGKTSIVADHSALRWWTFAGVLVNACFANALAEPDSRPRFDDSCVYIERANGGMEMLRRMLESTRDHPATIPAEVVEQIADEIKFIDCVPPAPRYKMVSTRHTPRAEFEQIAEQPVSTVTLRRS